MADDTDEDTDDIVPRRAEATRKRDERGGLSPADWFAKFKDQLESPRTLMDLLIRTVWVKHDDEQLEELRQTWGRSTKQWLDQKWSKGGDQPCPYCGHETWHIQSEPVRMESALDDQIFGAAQIVCANCGQFTLVAAAHIPIVDADE